MFSIFKLMRKRRLPYLALRKVYGQKVKDKTHSAHGSPLKKTLEKTLKNLYISSIDRDFLWLLLCGALTEKETWFVKQMMKRTDITRQERNQLNSLVERYFQ